MGVFVVKTLYNNRSDFYNYSLWLQVIISR